MNDSGQLYVTGTTEPDQYAIDNYSGHQFNGGELMPVEEYFRVSGYFGSYGPHMFAAAPKLLEALKIAVRQNSHDMIMTGEELRICELAIAQATGEK